MTSIIICAHGELAYEFKNSAEMIFGDVKEIFPISFHPGESTEELKMKIKSVITENKFDEVLIFTDIFSGSPYNAAAMIAIENNNVDVIAGTNLPLILETIPIITTNLKRLIQNITESAPETIKIFSEVNQNSKKEDDLE
ncbi:PTS sugar transporter subunit IIA [Mammaliicoccus lentus]|uniref:PTS sugar transporter subunit IIA n=1 Tax=Mammaliicoccus lentus TaxID=42858 RepID=UPI003F56CEBF